METTRKFENYPVKTVYLSNFVSFGIYCLGLFIIQGIGWALAVGYLFYILVFEFRLMKYHCTKCYYWGKRCGFGRSKLSSRLFEKGNVSDFCVKDMTWKDMIPDILITLIPLIAGIVLLIIRFDIIILSAMLALILLTTAGNGYIRGSLTCKHCKQQELGCPADILFNKNKHH